MLHRVIIAVCSEIQTKKHINTVCGQNIEFFFFVKRGGIQSKQLSEKK